MKKNTQLLADLSLLGFLLATFIMVVFVGLTSSHLMQNIIFMNLALILALVTYFTNITTGLTLNLVYIFIQGSYALYQILAKKDQIFILPTYFWLVMTPIFSALVFALTYQMRQLQKENTLLQAQSLKLGIIDAKSKLRNLTAFNDDAQVFMDAARRLGLENYLIVFQMKFWKEVEKMLSAEEKQEVIRLTVDAINASRGDSGIIYILDEVEMTFGVLIFKEEALIEELINNFRSLYSTSTHEFSTLHRIQLEIKIAYSHYEPEAMPTPYSYLRAAIKELEYDV
ncbi:GGDEF domain-containing protein [Vagococcus sp. BWB3-3]|uniref:GGDEF domain-containing protein n=1 Tax=Vagococcus allomyrinae TaxID=2794353 RepID=A0A940P9T2_9ENTE|nr:GGDEF domain-containing protein [Vagococcus allomyrinae]MBP1039471.1 GGDEF domain-containing protein [Vagococcus allomyrinae]